MVVAAVGRKARRRGWHPGAGGPGHGAPVLSWSASSNEAVERHSVEAQTRWERVGRVVALGGVARRGLCSRISCRRGLPEPNRPGLWLD